MNPTIRPTEALSLFLINPPTGAQWPARAGGLLGGFPNPAELICMRFAKNGLASSLPHKCAQRSSRGGQSWAAAAREPNAVLLLILPSIPSPAASPSLFSYTHRPERSGPHGSAGSWVDFRIPQNSFVCVLQKMGSRARSHPECPGRAPQRPQARGEAPGAWARRPDCLPYTPDRLPYTPTYLPYTARPRLLLPGTPT